MSTHETIASDTVPATPLSPSEVRLAKVLRALGWVSFTAFCLIFFTLIKLPEDKLKAFIQGNLAQALAAQGVTLSVGKSGVGVGWGISYRMRDLTLNFPPPEPPVKIESVSITPSLWSMLRGALGGSFSLSNAGGDASGSFFSKDNNLQIDADFSKLDLGKLGLLQTFVGLKAQGILQGSIRFDGDLVRPNATDGTVKLTLSKVTLDPQTLPPSLWSLTIPKVTLSDVQIEADCRAGRCNLKTVRVGKPGDDIQGTLGGTLALGSSWGASTIDATSRFSISPNLQKSFMLLDALLGAGKQSDGSYSFRLSGPLLSPNAVPGGST